MTKCIIDVESYIHRACIASQVMVTNDGNIFFEGYELGKAKDFLTEFTDNVLTATKASDYVFVIGSSRNFRKEINPLYKANRKDKSKPPLYQKVMEMVFETFHTAYIPFLEADDTCRIIYEEDKFSNIVVSLDKDLQTFPCKIYNPNKPDRGVIKITQEEATKNFHRQLIMGDATDGYVGIKGYGEKKAEKLLENKITLEEIQELYLANNMAKEDFVSTYNMAKIIGLQDYKDSKIQLYDSIFEMPT